MRKPGIEANVGRAVHMKQLRGGMGGVGDIKGNLGSGAENEIMGGDSRRTGLDWAGLGWVELDRTRFGGQRAVG